ncbi:unnamed protein product, partial [Cyprideis torosa]
CIMNSSFVPTDELTFSSLVDPESALEVTRDGRTRFKPKAKAVWKFFRRVFVGIFVTAAVAATWVAGTHSIKYAYLSREWKKSYGKYSDSHQNQTVAVYDAPFLTTWLCTIWTILFFPFFFFIQVVLIRDCATVRSLTYEAIHHFLTRGLTPFKFLSRILFFGALWVGTNYLYMLSLRVLWASDVMALYATSVSFVYLLSWVVLHEMFVGVRVVAVILCNTGIAFLAYMDGVSKTPTLGGVVLGAAAATGSAVYKVRRCVRRGWGEGECNRTGTMREGASFKRRAVCKMSRGWGEGECKRTGTMREGASFKRRAVCKMSRGWGEGECNRTGTMREGASFKRRAVCKMSRGWGDSSFTQVAIFFSLISLVNTLLFWPIPLGLYLTGIEVWTWNEIPWEPLLLAGALSLVANLLGNLGVLLTYDFFITLGLLIAVPLSICELGIEGIVHLLIQQIDDVVFSSVLDHDWYGLNVTGMRLGGFILISCGFVLSLFPENWPDYIALLLRKDRSPSFVLSSGSYLPPRLTASFLPRPLRRKKCDTVARMLRSPTRSKRDDTPQAEVSLIEFDDTENAAATEQVETEHDEFTLPDVPSGEISAEDEKKIRTVLRGKATKTASSLKACRLVPVGEEDPAELHYLMEFAEDLLTRLIWLKLKSNVEDKSKHVPMLKAEIDKSKYTLDLWERSRRPRSPAVPRREQKLPQYTHSQSSSPRGENSTRPQEKPIPQ